jgi:hypothetical protein
VPLLKGTWMTSPYLEDAGPIGMDPGFMPAYPNVHIDQRSFGADRLTQDDSQFAGLCMRCHTKGYVLGNYTGAVGGNSGPNKAAWKSVPRIHASVKGWGTNSMHAYSCSKCHAPHVSYLPRLMITNCLDWKRGQASVGAPIAASGVYSESNCVGQGSYGSNDCGPGGNSGAFPNGNGQPANSSNSCHPDDKSVNWQNNYWNSVTPW